MFVCTTTTTLVVVSSASAADQLLWSNGNSTTTFGANQEVVISLGRITFLRGCAGGSDDFVTAFTDVYVVPHGSVAPGMLLSLGREPHVIGSTAQGGVFVDESLGFTGPGGRIGKGVYDVVYDNCQDGIFNAGDTAFSPAFTVDYPQNIPEEPTAEILRAKAQAKVLLDEWEEYHKDAKAAFKALVAIKIMLTFANEHTVEHFPVPRPDPGDTFFLFYGWFGPLSWFKAMALNEIIQVTRHYQALVDDPPDPQFRQPTVLDPRETRALEGDGAVDVAVANLGVHLSNEGALLAAVRASIERYQGARAGSDGDWALVHARATVAYAQQAAAQLARTNDALDALAGAHTSGSGPLDGAAAELETIRSRWATFGFGPEEVRELSNLGLMSAEIDQLRTELAATSFAVTKTGMVGRLADLRASTTAMAAALESLRSAMEPIAAGLDAQALVADRLPVASAGGPYTGSEGSAVSFDGTASTSPSAITAYSWDLDGDGAFDDATGAQPSFTYAFPFTGLVGVKVTNADGFNVAYAPIQIDGANAPPRIDAVNPDPRRARIVVGSAQVFSVAATDTEGDAISVQWDVDGTNVATGTSFSYAPTAAEIGARTITATVSDGSPIGGSAAVSWAVSVLAGDGDGDGWNANVDCDEGDPDINPGHLELIGNLIDDDCDPLTFDTGSPPRAAFGASEAAPVGALVVFHDESADPNGDIVSWHWDFGDGATSTARNPTHTFAAKGTYTVTLTVADAQGASASVSHSIAVASMPLASFTYLPPAPAEGGTVDFTDASTDADGTIVTWSWTFGDGGTSSDRNPSHTYAVAGTYTVKLTVTDDDGTTSTVAQAIVVGTADPATAPRALFGVQATPRNLAFGPSGAVVVASSGFCCTGFDPAQMLDDAGTTPWATSNTASHFATIQLIRGGGYIESIQVQPRFDAAPGQRVKDFAVDVSTTGTAAADFTTVLTATAAENGDLQTFPLAAPVLAKYVRYRPLNNRAGTGSISTARFKVLTTLVGSQTVTFENRSSNAVSYRWDFGDGSTSTDASPTHTYATNGIYIVKLNARSADGRTNVFQLPYDVRGPIAGFSVDPAAPIPGAPVVFRDTSLQAAANLASWSWSFGDGATSTAPSVQHVFAAAGTYTVTLTVTDVDGLTSTTSRSVVVAPGPPVALFSPQSGGTNLASAEAGASIVAVSSEFNPTNGAAALIDFDLATYWLTGNGKPTNGWVKIDLVGTEPRNVDRIRIAPRGGIQRVKDFQVAVSTTGTADSAFTTVLTATAQSNDNLQEFVLPSPRRAKYVMLRILNNYGSTCCTSVAQFQVLSGPDNTGRNMALKEGGASILAFSSQFNASFPPDTMIDGNPSNSYWATANGQRSGFAKIDLAGTEERLVDHVRIQPRSGNQKVRDFSIAVSTTGTEDTDFVTVFTGTAVNSETLQDFELPFPVAAKHVLYRALTNRGDTCCVSTGQLKVLTGQEDGPTVRFRNYSVGAESYQWYFGDGSTSTEVEPLHTYARPGTYTVTLTATNASGSTSFSLEQLVRASSFTTSPASPVAGDYVHFTDVSELPGAAIWSWDFGDGTTSTRPSPVKVYAAPGEYDVVLTVKDADGNSVTSTQRVTAVAPGLQAFFRPEGTTNVASLEAGATVNAFSSRYDANHSPQAMLDRFVDSADLPWASGNGQTTNQWVKIELAGGQPALVDEFAVMPRPASADQRVRDFEVAVSTTGTADADFRTVLQATAANNGNLQQFELPRPVLARYVMYRPLNSQSSTCCISTQQFKAVSGQIGPRTVTFTNLSTGGPGLTYLWEFGDGTTSTETSPTHTFPGRGTFDVKLTVTDPAGGTASYTLRQRVLAAPVPTFTLSPATPNEGQSTTFTDRTPATADTTILDRRWTWGDGTPQSFVEGAATATHVFPDNKPYSVNLEVTDSWGQTAQTQATVTPLNVAPTVNVGPDWHWREERRNNFVSVTVADVGSGDTRTCQWDFGDGTSGTSCTFDHTYADPGDYTAKLTVTDDDGGVGTDSVLFHVLEKEIPAGGGGGGGSGGGRGEVVTGTSRLYTLDDDFDTGTLLNVNHAEPDRDQLQLNKTAAPFPFINIAASARGTAIRIDVNTGAILGEYFTAPSGRGRNPSRTTVDKLGNVWVTNRNENETRTINGDSGPWGSVSRVGLILGGTRVNADGTPNASGEYLKPPFQYSTCVDRNGDGLIRTSRGLANILAWSNTGGVDNDGGVDTATDECLINYIRVHGTNTRTVAVDRNNDVWVGGINNVHEKVDAVTGQLVAGTKFDLNCGGYGGFIDRQGVLWSTRYGAGLLRYDTNARTGRCVGNNMGDYGIASDPKTGDIWQTYYSANQIVKLSSQAVLLGRFPHGNTYAQGVAVDGASNVWVAHSLNGTVDVGHLRTDGTFVGNVPLLGGIGPTGVAVDANGKVWSANQDSNSATRIDPKIGPVGGGGVPTGYVDLTVGLGAGAAPYNYSDMTGFVSLGSTTPTGFWSIVQDSGVPGQEWKRISWTGSTPAGTSIVVEARAAETQAALGSRTFVTVANGEAPGVSGRFVEVRTTLSTAGTSTPVLFDITVSAKTNTLPVANDGSLSTERDVPQTFTLDATDVDGDTLAYTIVDAPAHGTLSGIAPALTYTPAAGYSGPDSFTFKAADADGDSNVATIAIVVNAINRAPIVQTDFYATDEDTTLTVEAPGVLENDSDPDGDSLTTAADVLPAHGVLTYGTDGAFTYVPAPDFAGVDSFTYRVNDGAAETEPVTVTIDVRAVNDPPVARDDAVATDEDTPVAGNVLANDTDVDNAALSTELASQPARGSLDYSPDGSFTYTPEDGFNGSDSFTYYASDGAALSELAVVTITVSPVNDAPAAADIAATTPEDVPLAITLAATDPDGDTLGYGVGTTVHGTLTGVAPDLTYQPPADFNGTDSFSYTVDDGQGGTDTATVTIEVTPLNDPPVADDVSAATDEDTPVEIALTAGDVDGGTPTITYTQPAHGSFDGALYSPDENFHGTDSFEYTATDAEGASDTATVTITVRPVNDPPVAENGAVTVDEDAEAAIDLRASDVDGDPLTLSVVDGPSHGTFTAGVYRPAPNYHGPDALRFKADDGAAESNVATIAITVEPVNDAPVCRDVSLTIDEDSTGTVAPDCLDVDGDVLAYTVDPAGGTLRFGDGMIGAIPPADENGQIQAHYRGDDGRAASNEALVTVTVLPVNDRPVGRDDQATMDEDGSMLIDVLANDSAGPANEDDQQLSIGDVGVPAHGAAVAEGGKVRYRPDRNYNGGDAFTYTLCDDGTTRGAADPLCDGAPVRVTIAPVNDPPDARDGAVSTDEDEPPIAIDLGTLADDLETADADLIYEIVDRPAKGALTGGGPVFSYDSADNAFGADSFTYRVTDRGDGAAAPLSSDIRTVTITIAPVNDPPSVRLAPAGPVDEGAGPLPLAASADDVDGDTLSYSWSATGGTVTGAGPAATFSSDDGPATARVTVTVADGSGDASATIEIAVRNVAPAVDVEDASGVWGIPTALQALIGDASRADTAAGFATAWTFGDGSSASAPAGTTHVYANPGSFTATLRATDKDGGAGTGSGAVAIGKRRTSVVYTGSGTAVYGFEILSARLVDEVDPATARLAGRTIVFEIGTRVLTGTTNGSGNVAVDTALPLPAGEHAVRIRFAEDTHYLASTTTAAIRIGGGPGKVTGGGLRSAPEGRGGFNVQSDGTSTKGELQWQKTGLDFHAHELTTLGVAPDGKSAWFAGIGRDGRAFVAYVEDNGEPGRNDVFKLWIGGQRQTTAEGKVANGNIQIHKQP